MLNSNQWNCLRRLPLCLVHCSLSVLTLDSVSATFPVSLTLLALYSLVSLSLSSVPLQFHLSFYILSVVYSRWRGSSQVTATLSYVYLLVSNCFMDRKMSTSVVSSEEQRSRSVNETPAQSYRMSLVIWDHTVLPVTWHKWTHSVLTPARGRCSVYTASEMTYTVSGGALNSTQFNPCSVYLTVPRRGGRLILTVVSLYGWVVTG